jgi:hypothetical protein
VIDVEEEIIESTNNLYLVFANYEQAFICNAIISQNMRLAGSVTQQWSEIRQRLDNKYIIPKPPCETVCEYIDIVDGYTKEEYSNSWFEYAE